MNNNRKKSIPTKVKRFSDAIRGMRQDRPPVWLMRQAGRYLPQYREVRKRYDFLTLCRTPEAAAEVSMQPLEVLDVDAVIVFNDILIPLESMGLPVEFSEKGPVIPRPLQSPQDLDSFQIADFEKKEPVHQTLKFIRDHLGPDVALIGFAGAPFTLACYAVEGKISKNFDRIKSLRYRNPSLLHQILERLTETLIHYLRIQAEAGVDLLQLFDTWASILSLPDYREFALPYQKEIFRQIKSLGIPVSLYVNGSSALLEAMKESGTDILSVDWRLPLNEVRRRVGPNITLQGNLDPLALLQSPEGVIRSTQAMLKELGQDPFYIANLGHGLLPQTPVESALAFVKTIRGETSLRE